MTHERVEDRVEGWRVEGGGGGFLVRAKLRIVRLVWLRRIPMLLQYLPVGASVAVNTFRCATLGTKLAHLAVRAVRAGGAVCGAVCGAVVCDG